MIGELPVPGVRFTFSNAVGCIAYERKIKISLKNLKKESIKK